MYVPKTVPAYVHITGTGCEYLLRFLQKQKLEVELEMVVVVRMKYYLVVEMPCLVPQFARVQGNYQTLPRVQA